MIDISATLLPPMFIAFVAEMFLGDGSLKLLPVHGIVLLCYGIFVYVCRVSELLVPVSSVGYALPAMSRLLAYAETVRFMETAFPSVPIASARTR